MIRGVNKQIIEINETQNEYFEKAILFVRPSKSDIGAGKLRAQAARIMGAFDQPVKTVSPVKAILRLVCAAIAGSAVTAVIMLIL